jgi:hypothetical protein
MRYSRWTPFEQVPLVVDHVRAHLSAVTSPTDDPDEHAGEVDIDVHEQDGGMLITGQINRQPVAAYLRDGFDPDTEAADNPLSVPSIEDQP